MADRTVRPPRARADPKPRKPVHHGGSVVKRVELGYVAHCASKTRLLIPPIQRPPQLGNNNCINCGHHLNGEWHESIILLTFLFLFCI